MIKYIPHNLVDRDKYDLCIAQAKNARLYAHSWYLDCVAEKWDVLMSDAYSKVMPLPCRKKYGINYVYMPSWTQQLGVFSKDDIAADEMHAFINSIPGKFVLVDYMLNASNPVSSFSAHKRNNFILPLHQDFEEIFRGYNKNRQRISKLGFDAFYIDKKGGGKDFLRLLEGGPLNYSISKDAMGKIKNLLKMDNDHIHIWTVYKKEKCVAGLVWLFDAHRITYLFPVVADDAKKEHVNTFLVNELIRDHQNSGKVLDFEGSMFPGVARFYKSFGAGVETYHMFKKRLFSHV
jgi:hypothetical protein